jgi:hypothetical protein
MTVHLTDQSVLEDAIRQLVKDDTRLKPILAKAGMPALRQRAPGFEGLAQIVCGARLGRLFTIRPSRHTQGAHRPARPAGLVGGEDQDVEGDREGAGR